MGSGISQQVLIQEHLNQSNQSPQSSAIQKSGLLQKFFSEPNLPTIRENSEQQVLEENDHQTTTITKIIYPYMHSAPNLVGQTNQQKVLSPSEMSFRRGERNYFLSKVNSRKGSWKEMELSAIISNGKAFTGNLRTFKAKKTKLKNVRSIAVTSHPKT